MAKSRVAPELRLNVTTVDIKNAVRKCPTQCMIKLAIERQVKGAEYILVDRRKIAYSVGDERRTYINEPKGGDALTDFDDEKNIKPFSLHLRDGIVRPRGWQAGRSPSASRRGKKYSRKVRLPRQYVLTKTRLDGYTRLVSEQVSR